MAEEQGEAFTLNKWQRCLFRFRSPDCHPRDRADALRGILNQLSSGSCQSLPSECVSQLKSHYTALYSSIIDCSNTDTGLNNYAEEALTLSANYPNESGEWTSSLTQGKVKNLDCIQELTTLSKKYSQEKQDSLRQAAKDLLAATQVRQTPTTIPPQRAQQTSSNAVSQFRPSSNLHQQSANLNLSGKGTSISKDSHEPPRYLKGNETRNLADDRTRGLFSQNRPFNSTSTNQGVPRMEQPPRPVMTQPRVGQVPRSGSGYDPTVQLCNIGVLGRPAPSDENNCQLLKRKLGATEPGRQGNFGLRSGPHQPQAGEPTVPNRSFYRGPRPARQDPEDNENEANNRDCGPFRSARDQLNINNQKKFGNRGGGPSTGAYGSNRKVLGVTRRGPNSKFCPPVMNKDDGDGPQKGGYKPPGRAGTGQGNLMGDKQEEPMDERLKNIDPKMVELVMSEIMDHGPPIHWDDIAGLEFAKNTIKEIVVWPMLRPDIFTGLRGPPKGLLLFGPPGTGKTLIGKCIACQSGATFFSISASSLTSKWVGEGEKMVRALFAVARCYQPAVIFIDEIDSLLSQRSNDEHESSRRIKTEFLVQLDGATTSSDERLLIVGATNRPQEIDEAARRRLVKRLYIPLPDANARKQIVHSLLAQQSHSMSEEEHEDICENTDGYSGADMANLCREAALGPIRSIQGMDIQHISAEQVRPIIHQDFLDALRNVRPSVGQSDLDIYLEWNSKFGCGSAK